MKNKENTNRVVYFFSVCGSVFLHSISRRNSRDTQTTSRGKEKKKVEDFFFFSLLLKESNKERKKKKKEKQDKSFKRIFLSKRKTHDIDQICFSFNNYLSMQLSKY